MACYVMLDRIHTSSCEDKYDMWLSLGYAFVRLVYNRVYLHCLTLWRCHLGSQCLLASCLVSARAHSWSQAKAFLQEHKDLFFPLVSPGPQCRAVELTALNRQALHSVQSIASKPSNVFCLAPQPLKSGLQCPSLLLWCSSIKGTLSVKLSEAPNSQDALLWAAEESQWPKQHLYAGTHMSNLTCETPAQTFKRSFWQFSLSPVLAEKLH